MLSGEEKRTELLEANGRGVLATRKDDSQAGALVQCDGAIGDMIFEVGASTRSIGGTLASKSEALEKLEEFAQEQLGATFDAIGRAELLFKDYHADQENTNFTVLEELEEQENSELNTSQSSQRSILSMRSSASSSVRSQVSDSDLIVELEVFECERMYPFIGWSKRLLPSDPGRFTDRSGRGVDENIVSNKPRVPATRCPSGAKQYEWSWIDEEWTVDPIWRYGTDFSSFSEKWEGGPWSRTAFVRRRQWTRSCCAMEVLDQNEQDVLSTPGKKCHASKAGTINSSTSTTKRRTIMISTQKGQRSSASTDLSSASNSDWTDPVKCLALLRDQVVEYKQSLTQYSRDTIQSQNQEIIRLKRELAIATRRSQSAFKTAANAMISQSNHGDSADNDRSARSLEDLEQLPGVLTKEKSRPTTPESSDSTTSIMEQRKDFTATRKGIAADQSKSAKLVTELNRQFSSDSIDIDEYALALAGLTQDIDLPVLDDQDLQY